MEGQDLATRITTPKRYEWVEQGADTWTVAERRKLDAPRFHVVAYDWGLKRAMLRLLAAEGCRITVVPGGTSAAETLALKPDGIFLTNGPGDPAAVVGARETVGTLLGQEADLRHLPGPPDPRRSRSAPGRTSSSSAIAARTSR